MVFFSHPKTHKSLTKVGKPIFLNRSDYQSVTNVINQYNALWDDQQDDQGASSTTESRRVDIVH